MMPETKLYTAKEIHTLVDEFNATRTKYAKFGASDSEPRYVFEGIMSRVIEGRMDRVQAILNGKDCWQLYTCSMDCTEAHAALTKKVLEVIEAVNNASYPTVKKVAHYYGWDY
jgi:hypothetical protein